MSGYLLIDKMLWWKRGMGEIGQISLTLPQSYLKKKEDLPVNLFTFFFVQLCARAKSLQSCSALCDPMDCSLPGSSVHGILQARILEWAAMPSSRRSSWHRDRTPGSCIAGGFFTTELQGGPQILISIIFFFLIYKTFLDRGLRFS